MPPMPMPPMPPGMGMIPAMNMIPPGAPPSGMHMTMDHPNMPPPGLTQDDQLKMVQQRAAIVLQQEERAKHQVGWQNWPTAAFDTLIANIVVLGKTKLLDCI